MLQELKELDFNDIGSSSRSVKIFLLLLLLGLVLVAGYFLMIKDKRAALDRVVAQESGLRSQFQLKQQEAANLPAYEKQLEQMQALLRNMFRQLPSKTEMDKLLVDVSQTALAAGIDVELFEPGNEVNKEFYAERPVNIRMEGDYHQFGEFVSGVASLPRVVILTMHDIALSKSEGSRRNRLVLEGAVKTYRYIDENEVAGDEP